MALEVYFRPTNELTIKVECRDVEDVFRTMSSIQEIFSNAQCGKCKSTNIRMGHRKADGKYDVYELVCTKCGAKLQLGKSDEGLFPRRYYQDPDDPKKPLMKDGKRVWLPDNGWVKWDSKQQKYV